MMGTEIFEMDASWAEKLTKTRVQFLLTPTVGVWLNGMSSVLTYTDMDLAAILGKKRPAEARHQGSFGKQAVYFIIVLCIQIG